jgi:hypothetical protein
MEPDPLFDVPKSLHGATCRIPVELASIIDQAFDYRGDVTLHLHSGENIVGFVFNRNADATPPYLQLFVEPDAAPRSIPYGEIAAVVFTGEDTASGKDWEAWHRKKDPERQTDAARVEAAARARGHL